MFSGVMENNAETFSSLASQSVFRNTSSSLQTGGGKKHGGNFLHANEKTNFFLSSLPLNELSVLARARKYDY